MITDAFPLSFLFILPSILLLLSMSVPDGMHSILRWQHKFDVPKAPKVRKASKWTFEWPTLDNYDRTISDLLVSTDNL